MAFSEKLKKVMQELHLNQTQVCGMTGKSKGSVSQYLSGKQVPPENVQSSIAASLGLSPDYFERPDGLIAAVPKEALMGGKIKRLLPEDVAPLLGMDKQTVRKGLQQGVFPWGYAVRTSEKRWSYFINAYRFAAIEQGAAVPPALDGGLRQEGQVTHNG